MEVDGLVGVECCCSATVAAHGHDKCPHLCVHERSSFLDRAEPLSASPMGAMTVSPLGAVSSWSALCLPWEMCLCLPWVLCKSLGCCLCVPWVMCLFLSWVLKGCCGTHLPSLISGLHFPAPSPNLLHLPCSAHGTQHITHQHPSPSTCTLSTCTQYSAPSTRHLAPCWDRQVSESSQHLACKAWGCLAPRGESVTRCPGEPS